MKKILIASYYLPPCNMISAGRAQSFADNFHKHGLFPIIVTRHWQGDEISTEGYESENLAPPLVTEHEGYRLIQLPYRKQLNKPYQRAILKTTAGKRLLYTALYASGTVNPKCNAYACFKDYLVSYLSTDPVDYILATGFPMNTIRLGAYLSNKFSKPFIADFRDLWDNDLLSKTSVPSTAKRLQNFFYEHYLRRWLVPARLITGVSQPIVDEAKRLAPHTKGMVVTNGFEAKLFADLRRNIPQRSDKFVFSVIGTLHPNQNLSVMLYGLTLFLGNKDLDEIELNFIGTATIAEVGELIASKLPAICLNITGRVPRSDALEVMLSSHVLFHAGWPGHSGIASGKLYEYLGAHRNILIAPNDHGVMEKIVTETNAGKLADTAEEFASIMNDWFSEWTVKRKLEYFGDDEKIAGYAREEQAKNLALEILKI